VTTLDVVEEQILIAVEFVEFILVCFLKEDWVTKDQFKHEMGIHRSSSWNVASAEEWHHN
jgi:hypothetical protein